MDILKPFADPDIKIMSFKIPEKFRITDNPNFKTKTGDKFGAFRCVSPDKSRVTKTFLYIIATCGFDDIEVSKDWEHVSVRGVKSIGMNQVKNLTPSWDEMCFVKNLFWEPEDLVVQYHPKKSEYINMHPNVLHLWRFKPSDIPTPPKILVGF